MYPGSFVWTQILTALIVGLLSAFAFQLLLTILGMAIGISIWQVRATQQIRSSDDFIEDSQEDGLAKESQVSSKIGLMAGLGILLTINTVLFIACFLAVKFTQLTNPTLGAIAGIVIWSAYFLLLIWISSVAVNSLMESVFDLTIGGFRRIISMITAALRLDRNEPITEAQALTIIHQEIESLLSPVKLQQMIEEQLQTISLADIPALPPESEALSGANGYSSTTGELWQEVAAYLDTASPQKLTPKRIERKLQKILQNAQINRLDDRTLPKGDRLTLKKFLNQRQDLSDRQKKRIVKQIEATWEDFLQQDSPNVKTFPSESPQVEKTHLSAQIRENLVQAALKATVEQVLTNLPTILQQLQTNLPNWSDLAPLVLPMVLDRVRDSANPSDSPSSQKPALDHNLVRLVENAQSGLTNLNQSLVTQTESLREQLMQQSETIQQAAQERIESLKQQTQQRIEQTRQAAATASWWLFIIAFTGAVSSALAGTIAARF